MRWLFDGNRGRQVTKDSLHVPIDMDQLKEKIMKQLKNGRNMKCAQNRTRCTKMRITFRSVVEFSPITTIQKHLLILHKFYWMTLLNFEGQIWLFRGLFLHFYLTNQFKGIFVICNVLVLFRFIF